MNEEEIKRLIIEELVAAEYQDNYSYEDIANSIIRRLKAGALKTADYMEVLKNYKDLTANQK